MKRFYLFAITLLSLASCQQEDIATNGMYSDAFMSKLKFNTINVSKTRAFDNGKDAEEWSQHWYFFGKNSTSFN